MEEKRKHQIRTFLLFLCGCLMVGGLGGMVTAEAISGWYAGLTKPALNPPDFVFGPVWTTLYVLMAISAFRIWQMRAPGLRLFWAQLFLNGIWSFIFFGLRSPFWAAVDILLLWALIVAMLLSFRRRDSLATWLLLPYLVWVSFAVYLNIGIWLLNRSS